MWSSRPRALLLLLLLLPTLLLLLGLAGASPRPDAVAAWDPDDVAAWIGEQGFAAGDAFKDACLRNGVSGRVLFFLDADDLEEDLGVSSGLQRKKILAAIDELHGGVGRRYGDAGTNVGGGGGGGGGTTTMNFHEYRALNRQFIDHFTPLVSAAPRVAISMLSKAPGYGQPASACGWFVWLVIPEYYLYSNSGTILGGLPGLLPYLVICNLTLKVIAIVKALLSTKQGGGMASASKLVLMPLATELFVGVFAWVYITIFWPFIPWFICDLIYYFNVYVFSLFTIVGTVKGLVKTR